MQHPIIILVAPQMGENIGAAARAMKNFSIDEMRIVSPRDGWPNPAARATAVAAVNIIDNAKIYTNLEDAVEGITYLYATSALKRNMNKDYILSSNLAQDYPLAGQSGIMFGRENCGLTNHEITLANKILTIHSSEFSSLNIAQAVAIVCYELFRNNKAREAIHNRQNLATKTEVKYLLEHLFTQLERKNFFKVHEKKDLMKQNITNIFSRIDKLSVSEVKTLRGIISNISMDDNNLQIK